MVSGVVVTTTGGGPAAAGVVVTTGGAAVGTTGGATAVVVVRARGRVVDADAGGLHRLRPSLVGTTAAGGAGRAGTDVDGGGSGAVAETPRTRV